MSTAVFHRPEHGREAGHLDDFSEYGIVDRLGTTLELIPHLFGASNRHPADQRGLYVYSRAGPGVLAPKRVPLPQGK